MVIAHCFMLVPFSQYMIKRPLEVKLGYLPHPQLLKVAFADHRFLVAEVAVVKVLFYYGTLLGKFEENIIIRPEHINMYRTLVTATQLDPYNMDAYYFAQAAFTWELQRIAEVDELLEHGLKYRTWDYWIPFYLGFNNAYFLKNYRKGAMYMQRAAEISQNPLFAKLAARYFYESKQTDLGLTFLDSMIAQAKDKSVKRTYELRRNALLAVSTIESALTEFRKKSGRPARTLNDLLDSGLLGHIPKDPYGGNFYLDDQGRARSTSKFANPKL